MTLKEALDHTKSKRDIIKPNPYFLKSLQNFEKQLYNNKTTINLLDYWCKCFYETDEETKIGCYCKDENIES